MSKTMFRPFAPDDQTVIHALILSGLAPTKRLGRLML